MCECLAVEGWAARLATKASFSLLPRRGAAGGTAAPAASANSAATVAACSRARGMVCGLVVVCVDELGRLCVEGCGKGEQTKPPPSKKKKLARKRSARPPIGVAVGARNHPPTPCKQR